MCVCVCVSQCVCVGGGGGGGGGGGSRAGYSLCEIYRGMPLDRVGFGIFSP